MIDPHEEDSGATSPGPSEQAPVVVVGSASDVREALGAVIDPEIGFPIVELGLVYDINVPAEGDVEITYTLTSLGCPSGPMIDREIKEAVASLPWVRRVSSTIVFQPPWTPDKMSDEAKAALGIF